MGFLRKKYRGVTCYVFLVASFFSCENVFAAYGSWHSGVIHSVTASYNDTENHVVYFRIPDLDGDIGEGCSVTGDPSNKIYNFRVSTANDSTAATNMAFISLLQVAALQGVHVELEAQFYAETTIEKGPLDCSSGYPNAYPVSIWVGRRGDSH